MAAYRKISVTFWSDSFVQALTPEGKYFYLYLMTNTRTTQCGIYEITLQQMCFDTGYNQDTVNKLLTSFEKAGKIKYSKSTNEIALKNWPKYNSSESPKVLECVKKELGFVKNRVLIQYLYSMDTQTQETKEEEETKEETKPKEKLLPALPFDSIEFANAWIEWEKYRAEKKQKLTPSSVKKQIAFLGGRPEKEAIEIINTSITNGWTGLFELKNGRNGKAANGSGHYYDKDKLARLIADKYGTPGATGQTGIGGTPDGPSAAYSQDVPDTELR